MPKQVDHASILDGRFALSKERREGGMAWVQKAMDLQMGKSCAIKRMLPLRDELLAKESFHRELDALQALCHPNIVSMVHYGVDDDRRPYLVLEWVEDNLEDFISARTRPMRWSEFWPAIGRPVLEAIVVAQSKNYLHRDIKPKNILIASGIPKISDYGISRLGAFSQNPVFGRPTFRDFSTKPYSPPEGDNDAAAFARDGYSWAVVALYCLTQKEPTDYGAIPASFDALIDAPSEILKSATSISPEDRPSTAAVLLQELDEWQEVAAASESPPIKCCLSFGYSITKHLATMFGPEERDPVGAFLQNFEDQVCLHTVPEQPAKLRIVGTSWDVLVSRDPEKSGKLIAERARMVGERAAERRRDRGWNGQLKLSISEPLSASSAEVELDELFADIAAMENEHAVFAAQDRERVFRTWFAYLQAREDFERAQGSALKFTDRQVSGRQVILTVADAVSPELVGQERLIRVGARSVQLEVVSVLADEVTLEVTFGNSASIPPKGTLETSTIREEIAIERQRQALNAIVYNRSANSGLRGILLSPDIAVPPLTNIPIADPGKDFDDDKVDILKKALGLQDVLAVEGPPGTGKTRLIEEIIIQYLDRNPTHRVLLSSQTHVALDNVIERVSSRNSNVDIVRVGRFNDPKIAAKSAGLLLERKAEAWSLRVAEKARIWLEQWAKDRGVDAADLRAGVTALGLSRVLAERTEIEQQLKDTENRVAAIVANTAMKFVDGASSIDESRRSEEEATTDTAALQSKLNALHREEYRLRNHLSSLDGYKRELSESQDSDELAEYAAMLFGNDEAHKSCLALMRLQENWLERVGRSTDFHAAMLASANVVAATCVGLAAVRGINDVTFDLCIVDEASKATATEVLVPLSRSRRSILVGDPRQLPPFFEKRLLQGAALSEFSERELRLNVFDLLLASLRSDSKARLRSQYRMACPIGNLISDVFYDGDLVSPRAEAEISFPSYPKLVTWLDTSRTADHAEEGVGTSFRNVAECRVIRHVTETLAFTASKRKGAVYDVAIIAGYQAQVKAIEDAIRDQRVAWPGLRIRVNTVDAFQGSQADICIYSVVRSNERGNVGFLREPPRLNVALSRARDLLIIVGDHDFCTTAASFEPLANVIRYIADHPTDCEVRPANDT